MARQIIDIGTIGNDGTGDSIRASFRKVNDNFQELYGSLGLGEKLKFINLGDVSPSSYEGQIDADESSFATRLVTVNNNKDGVTFKRIIAGDSIRINWEAKATTDSDPGTAIEIINEFTQVEKDQSPRLGGNLSAKSGDVQYRINDLPVFSREWQEGSPGQPGGPITPGEGVSKSYADAFVSRAGVDHINPAINRKDPAFGRMSGPLVLARDPEAQDDELYDGLVAATKRYVDSAAFGSSTNIYVSTTGQDVRSGLKPGLQGSSLSYAYRTIEAALKKAEEIIKESRVEIGPYRKVLTYGGITSNKCTLDAINESPDSGEGFSGTAIMSADGVVLETGGSNYFPGDVLTVLGGTVYDGDGNPERLGGPIKIEVLSTLSSPGAIAPGGFRVLSAGSYRSLPPVTTETVSGSTFTGVNTTILPGDGGGPQSVGAIGQGAKFRITYRVNSISIADEGTGYGLVSVRIQGGGGTGAFGTADVVGGSIVSISVTDSGSGFTSVPTVVVNLPRLAIFTDGLRTDFTGITGDPAIDNDPDNIPKRDIREGLFLRGETSGAIAQILSHGGKLGTKAGEEAPDQRPGFLDLANPVYEEQDRWELFDVDIQFGEFQEGEVISFGDVTRIDQISVLVESGVYEENYPLRIPQNVAVIGDEFRRVIIKPRDGMSTSPWAFTKFRRDLTIGANIPKLNVNDTLTIADTVFGHHYLEDSSRPVYPKISNKGNYKSAATLLASNRSFIQEEVIGYIDSQIIAEADPFTADFEYDSVLCKRDLGLLIDSMVYDLKYGEYYRSVSAALKYYQNTSGLLAITPNAEGGQLEQTAAAIEYLGEVIKQVIGNDAVEPRYQGLVAQSIDLAFVAEEGSADVVDELIATVIGVISDDPALNKPMNNDEMDVFLCNDANIVRALTCQGHGGFMMVLDPTGQILTKSPYAQECASFSRSINKQTFAGGMYSDGFSGNLQFFHDDSATTTRISVSGLERFPELPSSFIVNDEVYRVNYVRDYIYNKDGSTATLVLDEITPFELPAGPQTITNIATGEAGEFTKSEHKLQPGATIVFRRTEAGAFPGGIEPKGGDEDSLVSKEYYVLFAGLTDNVFRVTETLGSLTPVEITSAGTGTIQYQRLYEILTPGNRSMLANDFTQINDLGYGAVANNGGLLELVSMFTYYCWISYYSINGGQIRSVAGSSAHGKYALVAQGSDPLELPTPTSLWEELSQGVSCYRPDENFANDTGRFLIWVTNYSYTPLPDSELEIVHDANNIVTYPITAVDTANLPSGVAQLTIGNDDGLFAPVLNNTKMTLRASTRIVLTGDLTNVSVRPSTGLVTNELPETVYRVLDFDSYDDPNGPYEFVATPVSNTLGKIAHRLREGYTLRFTSTGTLPDPLETNTTYWVISEGLTDNEFKVSNRRNGDPIDITDTGAGDHFFTVYGLTSTKTRETYDYIEVKPREPGEFVTGTTLDCTFDNIIDAPILITTATEHGFVAGDVVRFGLYNDAVPLPEGLSPNLNYHVITEDLTDFTFKVSPIPEGASARCSEIGVGIYFVGKVTGRGETEDGIGNADDNFAIEPLSAIDGNRVVGYKFVWLGEEYTVTEYRNPATLSVELSQQIQYGRIYLDRPLVNSLVRYSIHPTLKVGAPAGVEASDGSLTVRISLTRVTGHDLLDIGTGSYSDTNYPNEIYGSSVNTANPDNETQERTVGRVFYVTTDQFGNFKVGDLFRVDQGTGTVTFSANIAISNLDGLGFKRGVPISEFSTDTSFSDGALDTVPTEYATRIYIDRRLGLTHEGTPLTDETQRALLIPSNNGGFLALNGSLRMKGDINMQDGIDANVYRRVVNLEDPDLLGNGRDAMNLRSHTVDKLQDVTLTKTSGDVPEGQILAFTGDSTEMVNVTVTGDLALTSVNGTLNQVTATVTNQAITDQKVSDSAGIKQSKLDLDDPAIAPIITSVTATGDGATATLTFPTRSAAPYAPGSKIVVSGLSVAGYNGIKTVVASTVSTITFASTATTSASGGTITSYGKGIAAFNDSDFSSINGHISVKTNGLSLNKLQQINSGTLLGNFTGSVGSVEAITFNTVVDAGSAIKKTQYNAVGFLKRNSSTSNSLDSDYGIIDSSAGNDASTLVIRDSSGNFATNAVTLNELRVGTGLTSNNLAINRTAAGTGGNIRYFGFGQSGGIQVGGGTNVTDRITSYLNESHQFRNANGSDYAPMIASELQLSGAGGAKGKLTTGGNTIEGEITGRWTLTGTSPNESRLQATYSADLAEYYEGDKDYPVGTVLVFGGEKEVTISNKKADTRVAGVVSNTAAFVLYDACPGFKNLVALQGRVPVKVVGKIQKGDLMITSSIPGVAVSAKDVASVGTVIGKALENYDSDHIGTIEVAVGRT